MRNRSLARFMTLAVLFLGARPAGAQWTTWHLLVPRNYPTATSVGHKALIAGGLALPGGPSSVVDVYDYDSDAWSAVAMSQARYSLASTSVGQKALFAGGYVLAGVSSRVDVFDLPSGTWTTALLSEARGDLVATSVGNLAFFAGGNNGNAYSASVDIYDLNTNSWSTAALSVARSDLTAASVGTKAFFAGGRVWPSGISSDVIDIFDSNTGAWSVAHLSAARVRPAGSSAGTKALFAGGDAGLFSTLVDIYDAQTASWSLSALSEGRYNVGATALGTRVLFAGGFTSINHTYSAVVDVYDVGTNAWSVASLSQSRMNVAATSVGSKAIFAGGETSGSVASDRVDVYTAFADCNHNGIPDSHDITNGTSTDCNNNGIPDECEANTYSYCTAKVNSLGCVPVIGSNGGCSMAPSLTGPDSFSVTATSVLNSKLGLLIWGSSANSAPFHGGTLCVGSPIARTSVQHSGGTAPPALDCSGTYSFHFSQAYMAGQFIGPGSQIYAQYWSRDPGFAAPDNIGLSNALHFAVIP
jgi:hypothetical protein